MSREVTAERRRELCETAGITLNGKSARVCGYRHQFATVRDVSGLSAEWAWQTVDRIVTLQAGRFES